MDEEVDEFMDYFGWMKGLRGIYMSGYIWMDDWMDMDMDGWI